MKGSCLCGRIEYETPSLVSPIQHCSCRSCRKAHAAAFSSGATVSLEDFRWLKGEDLLRYYESSPGKRRYFCGNCGTHLVAKYADRDSYILRVATLDDDPGQVPERQIWASHEVPWLRYGPGIAAYPEWQPGKK